MAAATKAMVIFLVFTAMNLCMCEVYKVGDATGWTTQGNFNYSAWASNKTFHVGDTLLFEYNKQFHNVLTVTKANYQACIAASPLETYTTGNDSIPVTKTGHHYYICGFPGHCSSFLQKVDINVVEKTTSLPKAPSSAPTPSMMPPPLQSKAPSPSKTPSTPSTSASSAPAISPAPNGKSSAPSIRPSFSGFGKLGLALAVVAVYSVSAI